MLQITSVVVVARHGVIPTGGADESRQGHWYDICVLLKKIFEVQKLFNLIFLLIKIFFLNLIKTVQNCFSLHML